MPVKAPSICGCGIKVAAGSLCPCAAKQKRIRSTQANKNRPSANQRGYSNQWRVASKAYLALPENRQCAVCGKPARAVDHIKPHKGNHSLFWDKA